MSQKRILKKMTSWILTFIMICGTMTSSLFGVKMVQAAQASDLFISEYIEGSSINKAIEIYNGTGDEVNLSDYRLELYSNGATEPSNSSDLSGILGDKEVFVIANPGADASILAQADETNGSVINFNGDDVIVLKKGTKTIDAIGSIGNSKGNNFAADVTLVRDKAVTSGNSTYTSSEWEDKGKNNFDFLGFHEIGGSSHPTGLAINHTPVTTAIEGEDIELSFEVMGAEGTVQGAVYYKEEDATEFNILAIDGEGPNYEVEIDDSAITEDLKYYIEVADNQGIARKPESGTYSISIQAPASALTIAEARAQSTGEVTVKGIVTSDKGVFIQDETAGINLYRSQGTYTPVNGDEIEVTGTLTEYNGLLEIKNYTATLISSDNDLPIPQEVSIFDILNQSNDEYEGERVKLTGVTIGEINTNGSTTLTDQNGDNINIYKVPALTGISVGDTVDVTAIVSVFNSWQLHVANAEDVIKVNLGPDTQAPSITHNPITTANVNLDTVITATVADDRDISSVKLYYRTTGEEKYQSMDMILGDDIYSATITKDKLATAGLEYYIQASDGTNTVTNPTDITKPYSVTVSDKDMTGPEIIELIPADQEVLSEDNLRPSIQAKFKDAAGIDETSIKIWLDEIDVTTEASVKTEIGTVSYTPASDLEKGKHTVKVEAKDKEGNITTKTWTFTIGKPKYDFYFGQLHSHTNYSDGQGTGEEAFAWARDKGEADFFAITDHSNWFDADTENENITDWNESTSKTWKNMHEDADQFNEDGKFVAIAGYEMTWSDGTGHINTFNTPWFASRSNDDMDLPTYYDKIASEENIDSINQLNHPGTTFGDFADFGYYSPEADEVVQLIEVGNGEGPIRGSGYFPSYEYYTRALDKGWHIAPANNQDNHKGQWVTANEARTVVLASQLTREGIYDGIRNLRVYATEDKNLEVTYEVNNQPLGTILNNAEELQFHIQIEDPDSDDEIGTVSIIADGGIEIKSKEFNDNTAEWDFTLEPSYSYYYVRIDQEDKDIAVTAPVWAGEVTPVGIAKVEVSENPTIVNNEVEVTATIFNNGTSSINDIQVDFYEGSVDENNKLESMDIDEVGAGLDEEASISWTPEESGTHSIYVNTTINGKVYTSTVQVDVLDMDEATLVVLDGGHDNAYVTGSYANNYDGLSNIMSDKDMILRLNENELEESDLKNAKVLILTDPASEDNSKYGYSKSKYTEAELQMIKDFVDQGGNLIITSSADYKDADGEYQNSAQGNSVLETIGSNLRFNDDEVWDDVNNDGMEYRLLFDQFTGSKYDIFPEELPYDYRVYSGCSVVLDESGDNSAIDWLVQGHDTTISKDADEDGDATSVDPIYVLAAEELSSGAKIVVAGSTFFSDYEVSGDNQYANGIVTEALLTWMVPEEPVELMDIKDIRVDTDGDEVPDLLDAKVAVEGYVTVESPAYSKAQGRANAFFDVLYIQDETGGITVFGISEKEIPLGTKVRIEGTVDQYDGDTEIQVEDEDTGIIVLDKEPQIQAPKGLSTGDSMKEENEGWLVKIVGTVTNITANSLFVNDGSGEARVYVNGYIGDGTGDQAEDQLGKWDASIQVGDQISAIGLASEDAEGHRLRVRNTSEIQKEVPDEARYEDQEKLLNLVGRFTATGADGERGVGEIVKYDKVTKKAFVVNGAEDAISIDIVDLSGLNTSDTDMDTLQITKKIAINDLPDFGDDFVAGDITCVDIHPTERYFAVTLANEIKTDKGRVAFFDMDGNYKSFVEVGALPDNLTFTPDGAALLVANEGEPNDDYSVDPEGSVSMIDVSDGVDSIEQSAVTTISFDNVPMDEEVIIKAGAEQKKDIEPEYITVDQESKYAYVGLQENNAIAKLNIANKAFIHIYGLGFKDHSVNPLDVSNKDDKINIQNWPLLGMYMPDGMDIATINGKTYIFTANEGDSREYDDYGNEIEVGDIVEDDSLALNAEYYEGYTQEELDALSDLDNKTKIGKLAVQKELGLNENGEYEALYSFGARSFSIWNADDLAQVYDSGSEFEEITAERLPEYFNSNNDEVKFDNRSDNKGPEPEDVKVGKVGDKYYAFVGLERIGGIMVYDVTDPEEPEFVQYINTRDFSEDIAGDCGPEGLKFVPAEASPTHKPLLLVANEVSGTLAVFEVKYDEPDDDDIKIATLSDPHYFAPSLGTSGAAFEDYLSKDRKLIAESHAIVEAAINEIIQSDVQIVLIPGDLTKDGEKLSHQELAELLKKLEEAGKKVFVINGNHDINNPHAEKYVGDTAEPVEYVVPEEFQSIYHDFGYAEAIAKDPNSLSYVVEPAEGLRIIAMDSAQYDTNIEDDYPKTEGEFSTETLNWIKNQIRQGRAQGKRVIGMMHHGMVEHFDYQQELFSQYVLPNWQEVSNEFADLGMEAVLTGHFHAQDIVKRTTENGNSIYDIETGSLVTYPCPYRLINLTDNNKMIIKTKTIKEIDYNTNGESFPDYAEKFLIEGLNKLVENALIAMMASKNATEQEIAVIKQQINAELIPGTKITLKTVVVDALAAHYQGDEKADAVTISILEGMKQNPKTVALAEAVLSIWNDPEPGDNDVNIQLKEVPKPQIPDSDDDDDDDDNDDENNDRDHNNNNHNTNKNKNTTKSEIQEQKQEKETEQGKITIEKDDQGKVKATVEVNKEKIQEQLQAKDLKNVVINATSEEQAKETVVKMGSDILKETAKAGKSLEITTEGATIQMDPNAIELENDESLELKVEQVDEKAIEKIWKDKKPQELDTVSLILDLDITSSKGNKKEKVTFKKTVKVSIKYDKAKVKDPRKVGIYYLNEDNGEWEYVGGKIEADGTITVELNHFSKYTAMEYNKTFTDINIPWAKDSIEVLAARHVVSGVDDRNYAPHTNISRAAFAKLLVYALNLKRSNDKRVTFSDVASGAWYEEPVEVAASLGIVKGDGNRFDPEGEITRQEMAVMIIRALKIVDPKRDYSRRNLDFTDMSQIADWAKNEVSIASEIGLVNGVDGHRFAPAQNATRAQAAVIIYRLLEELDRM